MFADRKKIRFVHNDEKIIDSLWRSVTCPLIAMKESPLHIVDDIDQHIKSNQLSNKLITYNILDKNGNELLSEWVRNITYIYTHDVYVVKNTNENELIEKYGHHNKECWEKYNVVTKEGFLLSDEWFDNITPSNGGYLRIKRRGKYNLLDLHGHFLLEDDAEFVSDYLADYAYCCRNGILSVVLPDGREEAIRSLDVYDESRDGKIRSTWRIMYLKGIYRKTIDEKEEWNYLVNYKNILFKYYYDKLEASGIQGLYFVWKKGETKLMDMAENVLTDFSFNLPACSYFIFGYAIIEIEEKYGMINHRGEVVHIGFTSVLWAPQGSNLWEMYYLRNRTEKKYFHGQGGSFVHYVHDFLIRNRIVCLLEKDNKWYYPDYDNNIVELFECAPESIDTDSDF